MQLPQVLAAQEAQLGRLYVAAMLKCRNSGRLLPRLWSLNGSRKHAGQARGGDNSSARSRRARVAPTRRLVKDRGSPAGPRFRAGAMFGSPIVVDRVQEFETHRCE